MAAGVVERKSAADLKAAKQEREAREQAANAKHEAEAKLKAAPKNGREEINKAHEALGTKPDVVPGVPGHEGSEIHLGDESEHRAPMMQLSMEVGGKKATSSSVTLTGGKLDIEQVFKKGQTVRLSLVVKVRAVNHIDQEDAVTGQIVGCDRRHVLKIVGCSVEGGG